MSKNINLAEIELEDFQHIDIGLKELLKKCRLNALVFCSSTSEPCKEFVKKLNQFKEDLHINNKPLQTILVSSDLNAKDSDTFFRSINRGLFDQTKHYTVKFNKQVIERLYTHFNVMSVPTVIILDNKGVVLTQYGRGDIEYKNFNTVYDDWLRMTDGSD